MRKWLVVLISLVFAISVPVTAIAADISGTWDLTQEDPFGNLNTSEYKFTQTGEKITVDFMNPMGAPAQAAGTVKGNEVYFMEEADTPMGMIKMEYSGTVDGNKIKGTRKMNEAPAGEWSAVKK